MGLTIGRAEYTPLKSPKARSGIPAGLLITSGEFTFDSAYATGGESLVGSDVGLEKIMFIIFSVEPSAGTGNIGASVPSVQYNYDTEKVMAFAPSAVAATNLAQEMNAGDLSGFTVRYIAFGAKLS